MEYGLSETNLWSQRLHAARILLPMESGAGLAACDIGFDDCAGVRFDSGHASVVRAQAARPAVQLDVRLVRSVHRGLRGDARDGSVEFVARGLLAGGRNKGDHGHRFGAHGNPARAADAPGAAIAEQRGMDSRERGAGNGSPRSPGTGTESSDERIGIPGASGAAGADTRRDLRPRSSRQDHILEPRSGTSLRMEKGRSTGFDVARTSPHGIPAAPFRN